MEDLRFLYIHNSKGRKIPQGTRIKVLFSKYNSLSEYLCSRNGMHILYTELYSKPETPGNIIIWCFQWEPVYLTGSFRSNEAILYLIRTGYNFTCLYSRLVFQRRGYEFGFFFRYSWPQSLGKWPDNLILKHSFGNVNDKCSEILLLCLHCFAYWFLPFLPPTFFFSPLSPKKLTWYWSDKNCHNKRNLLSQSFSFFPCPIVSSKKSSVWYLLGNFILPYN